MNRMRAAISRAALAPAQVTSESGQQSFCFAEEFPGFAGHFPGYPILPAILQTLLAQLLAEQVAAVPLQFQCLQRAKFTRQIRPGEQVDVSLSYHEEDGLIRCAAHITVGDENAASFTLKLTRGTAL